MIRMFRFLSRLTAAALLPALIGMTGCVSDSPSGESASRDEPDPEIGSFMPDGLPSPPESDPFQSDRPETPTRIPLPPSDYARWESDPARAMGKARALKRPLLLLFTGLEWSPNARLLGDEVFLSKSFNQLAREHLSLVYLDFPQNASTAPAPHRKLKDHYDVRGYPTVLLLDAKGQELFRKSGYTPGKAKDYFHELKQAVLQARGQTGSAGSEGAGA